MKTKEELCYYYPIDDKDLLEKFSCNNIELCMEEYFDDASQKVYLGTTNHTENHIEISPMSTQELSELLHAKKIESTNLKEKDNQDTDKKTEQDINIIISNCENNNIRIDIDVEELEAYVRERIFGQDEHLKGIITLLAMNYRTSNPQEIKKGLLIGPTGCGTGTYRCTNGRADNVMRTRSGNPMRKTSRHGFLKRKALFRWLCCRTVIPIPS